jgi:hypothetical protein
VSLGLVHVTSTQPTVLERDIDVLFKDHRVELVDGADGVGARFGGRERHDLKEGSDGVVGDEGGDVG